MRVRDLKKGDVFKLVETDPWFRVKNITDRMYCSHITGHTVSLTLGRNSQQFVIVHPDTISCREEKALEAQGARNSLDTESLGDPGFPGRNLFQTYSLRRPNPDQNVHQ